MVMVEAGIMEPLQALVKTTGGNLKAFIVFVIFIVVCFRRHRYLTLEAGEAY
jgi:hypothetical protein